MRKLIALLLTALVVTSTVGAVPAAAATETSTTTETATSTETVPTSCEGGLTELLYYFVGDLGPEGCWNLFSQKNVAEDLNATDARETKTSLYTSLSTVERQSQIANDSFANALEGTKTIARMEAKNAYIRALQNGSSKAEAKAEAIDAVEAYYSVRQYQLIQRWNVKVTEFETAHQHATSESGVTNTTFLDAELVNPDATHWYLPNSNRHYWFTTRQYQLANGTNVDVRVLNYGFTDKGGSNWHIHLRPSSNSTFRHSYEIWSGQLKKIQVERPYTDGPAPFTYIDAQKRPVRSQLLEIKDQHATVDSQISTFVDETYAAWEEGYINATEMVDPYLGAREYGPDSGYQSWTLRSLTAMGLAPPANMSQMGTMTVRDGTSGRSYEGILMSDGLSQDDSFEVGTTYDAGSLKGLQFVATRDGTHELTGNFTITNATTTDGANQSSITYNTVRYRTTSLTEFKKEMDKLQKKMAAINARQDNLRGGIGGGLLGGSSSLFLVALVALGAIAWLYDQNGGGNRGRRR